MREYYIESSVCTANSRKGVCARNKNQSHSRALEGGRIPSFVTPTALTRFFFFIYIVCFFSQLRDDFSSVVCMQRSTYLRIMETSTPLWTSNLFFFILENRIVNLDDLLFPTDFFFFENEKGQSVFTRRTEREIPREQILK